MFGFGKKKAKKVPASPADPLATYDEVLASLERQAGQVRKSAATLLAARSALKREQDQLGTRLQSARARLGEAEAADNDRAAHTLRGDVEAMERKLEAADLSLTRAEDDARLLKDAAEGLGKKVATLKEERQSAKLQLTAGRAVSAALQAEVAELDRVLKLDAARDEVERAHALAQVYKDDAKSRRR